MVRAIGYVTGEVQYANPYVLIVSILLGGVLGPLWVVSFWCFVLGRLGAPRVIMVVTLIALFITMVVPLVVAVLDRQTELIDLFPIALVLSAFVVLTMAVFTVPVDASPPKPRLWLGGYLAGAAALVAARVLPLVWPDVTPPSLDPGLAMHIALLLGMVGMLATSAGRRRPEWLFALALFGGGLAFLDLTPSTSSALMSLDVLLIILAIACALRGRVAARDG